MAMQTIPILATLLLAIGCCSPECAPDKLPHGGEVLVTEDDTHHEKLFELVQHCAKHECCDTLYGTLSELTRDEHSETKFCLFWDTIEIPEPYDYLLADVMKYGKFSGTMPGPKGDEEFVYVSYPPTRKEGKKNLFAQILVIIEKDEKGRAVPRIALEEQLRRMEAGDQRYYIDRGN
jgi:hypothetical protein